MSRNRGSELPDRYWSMSGQARWAVKKAGVKAAATAAAAATAEDIEVVEPKGMASGMVEANTRVAVRTA